MIRRVIEIDKEKCNGCGRCADACHEGAIAMVDGKAVLMRDDYCDGLGDCLPNCPTGAISFVEREAAAYDAAAAAEAMQKRGKPHACPGSAARAVTPACSGSAARPLTPPVMPPIEERAAASAPAALVSELRQWPVQIKLAPLTAPYFDGARLLIAADCTAYAYADFHRDFIRGHITLVGCPKLDSVDYSEKLTEILRRNDIRSVTIARMEVPCCGGLEMAAIKALQACGKLLPWQVVTIGIDGGIKDRT